MAKRYIAIHIGRHGAQVWCTDSRMYGSYCWRHHVAPNVIGYPNAVFKGFNDLNEAVRFAELGCEHSCMKGVITRQKVEMKMCSEHGACYCE